MGSLPYLGIRRYETFERAGLEFDLGLLLRLNFWLSAFNQFEVTSQSTLIKTNMPFSHSLELKVLQLLSARTQLGFQMRLVKNNPNSE